MVVSDNHRWSRCWPLSECARTAHFSLLYTEKCRKKSPQYYNLLRVSCLEEDFSGTTAPIWMPFGVRSGFGHSLPHTKGQPNRTTNSWEIALVILTGKMEKEGGIHRDSFSVLQLFWFIFTKRFLRNYCTDLDALWCVASWDQTLTWHQRASKSDNKRLRNRTGDLTVTL